MHGRIYQAGESIQLTDSQAEKIADKLESEPSVLAQASVEEAVEAAEQPDKPVVDLQAVVDEEAGKLETPDSGEASPTSPSFEIRRVAVGAGFDVINMETQAPVNSEPLEFRAAETLLAQQS